MYLEFYQNLPLKIDPIAFSIGSISLRWYALAYIIGFIFVYGILLWRISYDNKQVNQIFNFQFSDEQILNKKIQNTLLDFLLVEFFAIIIGGRIGYVLFYDFTYFFSNPLAIIYPYDNLGKFVGLFGMSFHGGLIGAVLAGYFFTKIKKINFWQWADFVVVAFPAGYFFGRIGNFLNGELYGRVTQSPFGMYFAGDLLNLRIPSQIIEAFIEGLLIFVILWIIRYKIKKPGMLFSFYLIMYAIARIIAEQFREPDVQLGFLFLGLTMGQLLSIVMLVAGIWLLLKKSNK